MDQTETSKALAATAQQTAAGDRVAAAAATGSGCDNSNMDWEEAIGDIAGLFNDKKANSGEGATIKVPPPSGSYNLPVGTTEGHTGGNSTAELQAKVKTYLAAQKEKAVEAAKGNLGPMRLIYEANYKHRSDTTGVVSLSGNTPVEGTDISGLYSSGDGRSGRAVIRCSLQTKENTSFSFVPETWRCNVCPANPGHAAAGREVVLLVDQSYPATLASPDEEACFKIIRLEFGTLGDLVAVLIKIGRGKLPAGSVVAMFSASHLANVGTAAYTQALANEARRLRNIFGANLTVAAAPPLLMNGTSMPRLCRSLLEVGAWLKTLKEDNITGNSWKAAIELIKMASDFFGGEKVEMPPMRMQLPIGMYAGQLATVSSENWMPMRSPIPAMSEMDEAAIVTTLAKDIREKLAIEVTSRPITARTAVQGVSETARNYLLIGTAATSTLAEKLSSPGQNVTKIWDTRWIPTTAAVERTVALMDGVMKQLNYATVVLQPFDDISFLQKSDDGALTHPSDAHIRGELHIASKELILETLRNCKPILEKATGRNILIVLPLPRYIAAPCCEDPSHVTNRREVDFYTNIKEGLNQARESVSEFLLLQGYNSARVVDPLLSTRGMSAKDIWGDSPLDPKAEVVELIVTTIKKVESAIMGGTKRKADEQLAGPSRERNRVEWDHKGPSYQEQGLHSGYKGHRGGQGYSGEYRGHHGQRYRGRGGGRGHRGW